MSDEWADAASGCPFDGGKGSGFCWCGKKLRGRQTRFCSKSCNRVLTTNHRWTQAKAAAKAAVQTILYKCARCGQMVNKVEVNHIKPCKGRHGVWGCWHHATNLEVLCIPCHRDTTNEQRKAGLI